MDDGKGPTYIDDDPEKIARRQHLRRAVARAGSLLKDGDRITFTSCPGTKRWGIFNGFTGYQGLCIAIGRRLDISALSISKVNGRPVDFSDSGLCASCAEMIGHGWNGTPAGDPSCPICSDAGEENGEIPF